MFIDQNLDHASWCFIRKDLSPAVPAHPSTHAFPVGSHQDNADFRSCHAGSCIDIR